MDKKYLTTMRIKPIYHPSPSRKYISVKLCCAVAVVFVPLLGVLLFNHMKTRTSTSLATVSTILPDNVSSNEIPPGYTLYDPSYESFLGVDYIWQKPIHVKTMNGVLLIVHGCKHVAAEWWHPTQTCQQCTGMPVERIMMNQIARKGLIPVSTWSLAVRNKSDCWHTDDQAFLSKLILHVYDRLNASINELPLFGLGIIKGAAVLASIATEKKSSVKGMFSAIAAINGGVWAGLESPYLPPLVFVDMTRNAALCQHNNKTVHHLIARNISARHYLCEPRTVSKSYFHDVGKVLSLADSATLFDALMTAELLWPGSAIMMQDPIVHTTTKLLKDVATSSIGDVYPAVDNLKYPTSPLFQLLNLAWSHRETTEEHFDKILKFFEENARLSQ